MLITIIHESCLYILGSASVNWEACLSKNKITAAKELFACVVSPAQALFLCLVAAEIVGKSHGRLWGGSQGKQCWMGLFSTFTALL